MRNFDPVLVDRLTGMVKTEVTFAEVVEPVIRQLAGDVRVNYARTAVLVVLRAIDEGEPGDRCGKRGCFAPATPGCAYCDAHGEYVPQPGDPRA